MSRQQEKLELRGVLQQAVTFQQQGRWAEGERALVSVLARDPENFDALNLLSFLKLQTGRPAEAAGFSERALKQRPRSPDAISTMAAALSALGQDEKALKYYDNLLTIQPTNYDAHYNRGVVLTKLRNFEQALLGYQRAFAGNPRHIDAMFNSANILTQLHRYEEALTLYNNVIALVPNLADVLNYRGLVLAKLARYQEAQADFDRALTIKPNYVDALCNKGTVLKELGAYQQSLDCYDKALAINPRHLNSSFNRGRLLLDLNRLPEALASFDSVLAADGAHVDALSARALILLRLDRMSDALTSIERALSLRPQDAKLLNLRAHVFESSYDYSLALRDYRSALQSEPGDITAISGIAECLMDTCAWHEMDTAIGNVVALVDEGRVVTPTFLLRMLDDPARQLLCATNYVNAHFPPSSMALTKPSPIRSDKIRVAYLSPDLRTHALAFLVPDMFERHDRSKFEITAISLGPDDGSEIRSRIVGAVDQFHDAFFKSDYEIANLLRELGIDIAVDLAGHTAHARFGIFSFHAAPIQVGYLGYCGTTGAGYLDYIIADPVALPFEQQAFYSEAIVHMPDCFMVNDAKQKIGNRPSRHDLGLPDKGFVFCCFNQTYKYTAPVFNTWMQLLKKLPGSVLWLSANNEPAKENLRKAAHRSGVDPHRIIFAKRVARREDHLARMQAADLFLDTLPYNAHSTMSDALWAGLPAVTCLGRSFAGRVGASLLHATGLAELVTTSLADYEDLAFKLASEQTRLAAIRSRLVNDRLALLFFDTRDFTRHIETAFTTMWQRCSRGEIAAPFAVKRFS